MIRIVLVDDDVLALTRLKQLIRLEDVQVAGEFTQAEQALDFLMREKADILITDMRMPKVDGIELIRRIKEAEPDVQLIAVSSYEDFHYVKMSFKEGSVDYILKHALNEESLTKALVEAIARVQAIREKKELSAPPLDEGLAAESRQALKSQLLTLLLKGSYRRTRLGRGWTNTASAFDSGARSLSRARSTVTARRSKASETRIKPSS